MSKGSLVLVKVNFGLKRPLNDSLLVASWLRFQPQILAASQLVPQDQLLFSMVSWNLFTFGYIFKIVNLKIFFLVANLLPKFKAEISNLVLDIRHLLLPCSSFYHIIQKTSGKITIRETTQES